MNDIWKAGTERRLEDIEKTLEKIERILVGNALDKAKEQEQKPAPKEPKIKQATPRTLMKVDTWLYRYQMREFNKIMKHYLGDLTINVIYYHNKPGEMHGWKIERRDGSTAWLAGYMNKLKDDHRKMVQKRIL